PVEKLTWIFDRDTFVNGWRDTLHISWSEPGIRNLKLLAENPAGCIVDTVLDLEVGGVLLGLDTTLSLTRGEQVQSETQVLDGKVAGTEIEWSPPAGLSCTDCLSPAFSPVTTTDYELTLTDTLGCISYYYT